MTPTETQTFVTTHLTRLTTHTAWLDALRCAQAFHAYSFTNRVLIWAQNPDATRVAGYRAWQSLGRQVVRGAHGIKILAPLVRSIRDDQDPDTRHPAVYGFRTVSVFDVSQTTGDPLPTLHPVRLTTATLADALPSFLSQAPVPVTRVPASTLHGAYGVYDMATRTIRIADDLAPDHCVKTLFHELAHHWGVTDAQQPAGWSRSWEECAAESTAYLALQSLGLDTLDYSLPYIAGWSQGNPAVIHTLIDSVSRRLDHLSAWIHQTCPMIPIAA